MLNLPPECLAELESARAALTAKLLAEGNRVAGFQRGPVELVKYADGSLNEAQILAQTHVQCFHCGSHWRDDGEHGSTRIALDRSAHYVAANPQALPENVGFNFPQWINRRLPWGKIMLEKLKRQRVAAELGNYEPLKQWWQKFAGRTWDGQINSRAVERPGASLYDVNEKIPGEKCRISATDIQFKLTHMVYLALAVGDGVPPRILHYEWVKPPSGIPEHEQREWCKNRVRALDKEFKIAPMNSMKDAAHEPGLVREWAAEDAIWGRQKDINGRLKWQWIAYGLLMGDDAKSYRWAWPGRKDTWERFKQFHFNNVQAIKDGKRVTIPVHHRLWSNWSIKEIAERWRDGNSAPKLVIHAQFLTDTSKDGLWSQLTSERPLPWKGRAGKLRYDNEAKPNHAWDAFCMVIVRMDELGYLNHFGPASEDKETE